METLNSSGKNSSSTPPKAIQVLELFESGKKSWEQFSALQKELLVKHYAPKIRYLASRLKPRLPKNIDLSELISAGTLGLMESFSKFKYELGIKFDTYCENRIKGAMLDELRRLDWFPRSLRQKVRQVDGFLMQFEQEHGRQPTIAEIKEKTGMEEKEVHQSLEAMHCQLAIPLDSIEETLSNEPSKESEPFHGTVLNEFTEHLAKLIDFLTDREKLVLSLYYVEELNMREVAEVLNITEGRVSQLHTQAVTKLRKDFKQKYGYESSFI